jgi:hypothetical protein
MLTVREFKAAHDRHVRRVLNRVCPYLMLGCVLSVLVDPKKWLPASIHSACPAWLVSWYGVTGIVFAVLLVLARSMNSWARRNPSLVCPHCNRGLLGWCLHVIGTRKCPFCQTEILTDPEPPKRARLTRAKAEPRAARERRAFREFVLWLAIFLVGIPVILACGALISNRRMSETVSVCIAIGMAVAPIVWLIGLLIRGIWLLEPGVRCPRCRDINRFGSALKYGRCTNCSQPLIREPADSAPTETPPK